MLNIRIFVKLPQLELIKSTQSNLLNWIYSIEFIQLNLLDRIYSIEFTQLNLLDRIYSIESTQLNLLHLILVWQLATQNLIILTISNPESHYFDDWQPRILLFWRPATQNDLVWRPATQNFIVLTTSNPESYHFDNQQLRILSFWQPATQNNLVWRPPNLSSSCHFDKQKNNVENSIIKSLKRYSRPNNQEKHLPEPLDTWKPGWTFYSVILVTVLRMIPSYGSRVWDPWSKHWRTVGCSLSTYFRDKQEKRRRRSWKLRNDWKFSSIEKLIRFLRLMSTIRCHYRSRCMFKVTRELNRSGFLGQIHWKEIDSLVWNSFYTLFFGILCQVECINSSRDRGFKSHFWPM